MQNTHGHVRGCRASRLVMKAMSLNDTQTHLHDNSKLGWISTSQPHRFSFDRVPPGSSMMQKSRPPCLHCNTAFRYTNNFMVKIR